MTENLFQVFGRQVRKQLLDGSSDLVLLILVLVARQLIFEPDIVLFVFAWLCRVDPIAQL